MSTSVITISHIGLDVVLLLLFIHWNRRLKAKNDSLRSDKIIGNKTQLSFAIAMDAPIELKLLRLKLRYSEDPYKDVQVNGYLTIRTNEHWKVICINLPYYLKEKVDRETGNYDGLHIASPDYSTLIITNSNPEPKTLTNIPLPWMNGWSEATGAQRKVEVINSGYTITFGRPYDEARPHPYMDDAYIPKLNTFQIDLDYGYYQLHWNLVYGNCFPIPNYFSRYEASWRFSSSSISSVAAMFEDSYLQDQHKKQLIKTDYSIALNGGIIAAIILDLLWTLMRIIPEIIPFFTQVIYRLINYNSH